MSFRKLYPVVLGVLLPLAVAAAAPQQDPSLSSGGSVADAARKARQDKPKNQAKPAKVITNEDLAALKGVVSVVGNAPAVESADANGTSANSPTANSSAADATKSAGAKAEVKDEAYWRKQFGAAHKEESSDARELDILQREFNLKQQQFYSDPNVALREQTFRTDLNATQQQIEDKKVAVEKDKAAIAALEEELRKAGGAPAWAQEGASLPDPPQPPSNGQTVEQPNTP